MKRDEVRMVLDEQGELVYPEASRGWRRGPRIVDTIDLGDGDVLLVTEDDVHEVVRTALQLGPWPEEWWAVLLYG